MRGVNVRVLSRRPSTSVSELHGHLDYELLALPDSFHTEGLFKRESSLFKQLVAAKRDRG